MTVSADRAYEDRLEAAYQRDVATGESRADWPDDAEECDGCGGLGEVWDGCEPITCRDCGGRRYFLPEEN